MKCHVEDFNQMVNLLAKRMCLTEEELQKATLADVENHAAAFAKAYVEAYQEYKAAVADARRKLPSIFGKKKDQS